MVNQKGKDQNSLLKPVESLLADKGIKVESGIAQTDEDDLVQVHYCVTMMNWQKVLSL